MKNTFLILFILLLNGCKSSPPSRPNGWYTITDGVSDSISKDPIATVKDFSALKIDSFQTQDKKTTYQILGTLNNDKIKAFAEATEKAIGHRIGFLFNGKIIEAPKVNYRIEGGRFLISPLSICTDREEMHALFNELNKQIEKTIEKTSPPNTLPEKTEAVIQSPAGEYCVKLMEKLKATSSKDFPEYLGGIYINENQKMVVQIIGDSVAGRKKIAKIIESNDFIVDHIVSSYSEKQLISIMDTFNQHLNKADKNILKNFQGAGVNTIRKRIDVHLIVTNEKTIKEFKEKVMDSPALFFEEEKYGLAPTEGISDTTNFVLHTEYPTYPTSTEKVKVTLYNKGEVELIVGMHYTIAYNENGIWKVLPLNYAAVDIGYIVSPGSNHSFFVNLLPDIHPNRPGYYRVYYKVNENEQPRKEHLLIAEFLLLQEQ